MSRLSTNLTKTSGLLLALLVLSGCSTVDNFFGGGLNDPENLEGEMAQNADGEMASDEMEMISEEEPEIAVEAAQPTTEDIMNEKDDALMAQAMRLAVAEKSLIALQEQNSALEADLNVARMEAEEKQTMLDEQNERQINQAAPQADTMRATAPDGGYGLHVASFELKESIAPGLAAIERQIPVLTEGRPIKVAMATVRGKTFHRLIIGQFNLQSEAVAECSQAKLLMDFCDVIAFEGEDF